MNLKCGRCDLNESILLHFNLNLHKYSNFIDCDRICSLPDLLLHHHHHRRHIIIIIANFIHFNLKLVVNRQAKELKDEGKKRIEFQMKAKKKDYSRDKWLNLNIFCGWRHKE